MTLAAHAAAVETAPSLARQPILTKDEKVIGYDVLFDESGLSSSNSNPASSGIVQALETLGLDVVCDGRLAFVECTEHMLLHDAFRRLAADRVVVEIPLDVTVNDHVIDACKRLKSAGYKIAIDHFRKVDHREYLVPFADFLKVDAGPHAADDSLQIAASHKGKSYQIVAQNVDSRMECRNAAKAGFTLFQGYFFRHPESMRVRQVPASQASRLRLLQVISTSQIDFKLVDELIRQDASLCYRLLRYLNSPLLGFAVPVQSVHHAITLLGERALTQWIRTATTLSMGQPKCSDLVLASLVRARFCELVAPGLDHGNADLFLLGMFSLMDVILETPMEVLVEGLAFDTSAKAALLAIKNGGGARLSPVLDLAVAREKGDWERVAADAAKLNLPLSVVNRAYIEAMRWAYELTKPANGNKAR